MPQFLRVIVMNLNELKPGQSVRIVAVGGEGALRQHFLDMGVIPGSEDTMMKLARWGILWSCGLTGIR